MDTSVHFPGKRVLYFALAAWVVVYFTSSFRVLAGSFPLEISNQVSPVTDSVQPHTSSALFTLFGIIALTHLNGYSSKGNGLLASDYSYTDDINFVNTDTGDDKTSSFYKDITQEKALALQSMDVDKLLSNEGLPYSGFAGGYVSQVQGLIVSCAIYSHSRNDIADMQSSIYSARIFIDVKHTKAHGRMVPNDPNAQASGSSAAGPSSESDAAHSSMGASNIQMSLSSDDGSDEEGEEPGKTYLYCTCCRKPLRNWSYYGYCDDCAELQHPQLKEVKEQAQNTQYEPDEDAATELYNYLTTQINQFITMAADSEDLQKQICLGKIEKLKKTRAGE